MNKLLILLIIIFNLKFGLGCSEAVCAAKVSKCLLIESCNCTSSDFDCHKKCFDCLDYLFDECCSCFNICPKSNRPWVPPGETSQVGDFDDPIPPLFEILTLKPDVHERWTVFSYNVESEINTSDNHENSRHSKRSYDNQEATKFKLGSANLLSKDLKTSLNSKKATNENNNCTVAFMVECMSLEKCKRMCESIGSSYWRWFHDGCCECAGQNCISYGLKKSTCLRCPFVPPAPKPQQEGPEEEEEYIDYGQWQDEEYECDPTVSVCPRLND